MTSTRRAVARLAAITVAATAITLVQPTVASAAPIPDEGLPAQPIAADPLVSERTEPLLAGVSGIDTSFDSFPNTQIRVAAFAEIDDVIYVGGKFIYAQDATTLVRTEQRYLAAFDRNTGAWINTFRPTLDGVVWDLKATDDGKLIVAGQFTNVNGVADTSGVAMIDPVTGDVDPTWRVDLVLTGSNDRPLARTLDIEGDHLYIGGNFTRITGPNGDTKNAGRAARVDLATGNADGAWLPNIDGVVFDLDAVADQVYIVGNFFYINGTWSIGMGSVQTTDGQLVPGLQPYVRTYTQNTLNSYQQAILSLGDDIWQTGAQHNTQVYRKSDYQLLRSFVSDPWGDGQALVELNGIVYKGSHANGDTYEYADTTSFPGLDGWTTRKPVRWIGAWDGTIGGTHDHLTWYPQIGVQNGEGGWELFADSTDCLWAGGDFNRGSYDGNTPRYVGGFAKFCATDTTPPEPPTAPSAAMSGGGVNLAWTGSVDDRGGEVRYELLKNEEVLASYISIETFRDPDGTPTDRYFVRAMDDTGNRSATTSVFTAADNDTTRPSTPQNLTGVIEANGDVTLTWDPSTDDVGVVDYLVFRNGVEIDTVTIPTATVPTPAPGDHYYQVRARDAAGNESFKTPSTLVTIVGPDTTRPSTPQNLTGAIEADGDVTLTWDPSTDDVGVVDYLVFRNGAVIDTVTDPTSVVPTPAPGSHFYQVRARDAAGNTSLRTPPIEIVIAAPDTNRPTTPQNLGGVQEANGDVTLTWDASTDDVGVVDYVVFRNGVEIDTVTGTSAVVVAPPLGTSWFQVRARDAAGNESYRTAPLAFVVVGDDTSAPSTPQNLTAATEANGDVTLTWDASTDDVGVTGYVVFRNGIVIDIVVGTTATTTPTTGSNYYQVRAVDAAGNESFKTPPLRVDV